MGIAVAMQDPWIGREAERVGVSLPLDSVEEPGTYICNWSGHLLRVPEPDPYMRGRLPCIGRPDSDSWMVTRISADPQLPRYQAKELAGRLGLTTNF
jgi:hypothetical protein